MYKKQKIDKNLYNYFINKSKFIYIGKVMDYCNI